MCFHFYLFSTLDDAFVSTFSFPLSMSIYFVKFLFKTTSLCFLYIFMHAFTTFRTHKIEILIKMIRMNNSDFDDCSLLSIVTVIWHIGIQLMLLFHLLALLYHSNVCKITKQNVYLVANIKSRDST